MKGSSELQRLVARCSHIVCGTAPTLETITQALRDSGAELCMEPLCLKVAGLVLRVDFRQGSYRRRCTSASRKQLLPRALGIDRRADSNIIDATAGLAQDSLVLATLGARVHMIERSPLLVLLVAQALYHSPPTLQAKMQLWWGEARALLPQLPSAHAIYLDPMYHDTDNHALPKKEAQILRHLATPESPTTEAALLARARQYSPRVVVKRAKQAALLGGCTPTRQLSSKQVRFDIYQA